MKKTLAILLATILMLSCFSIASAEPKTYKVGVSIYQYIMRKRIQYFSDLLLSSDDSIANLAAAMDEPDAKTLTRRFLAIMKCTPSEYRAAHLRKLR